MSAVVCRCLQIRLSKGRVFDAKLEPTRYPKTIEMEPTRGPKAKRKPNTTNENHPKATRQTNIAKGGQPNQPPKDVKAIALQVGLQPTTHTQQTTPSYS